MSRHIVRAFVSVNKVGMLVTNVVHRRLEIDPDFWIGIFINR